MCVRERGGLLCRLETTMVSLQEATFRPRLHPGFCPAVLARRSFLQAAEAGGLPVPVRVAIEHADGSVFHEDSAILANEREPSLATNWDALQCPNPRAVDIGS